MVYRSTLIAAGLGLAVATPTYMIKDADAGCTVSVRRQISNTPCRLGEGFGCFQDNNSMWATAGCMAEFNCNGATEVYCESHKNPSVGALYQVCPCVNSPTPRPPHPQPPGPPGPGPNPVPVPTCPARPGGKCPNIVFLIDESTDGRTYRPDGFAPTVIPAVRRLATAGVQFDTHYVNAPVCCPSRSSLWSGRQPHKIPHQQTQNPSLHVNGSWNNYEGNPSDYQDLMGDVLDRHGYDVLISGKTDWTTGGHSLNVRLNSWTMYTAFPYNVNKSGGWYDETDCPSNGSVAPNQIFKRHEDWQTVNKSTAWIQDHAAAQLNDPANARPFFAYQGMNIVHPGYATNDYWLAKIDLDAVQVPSWEALEDLHPCDFQASMLKKCTPADVDHEAFYSLDRRKRIRSIYYAMIAEFDAMVDEYVTTIATAGVVDDTVFIVTSDHGDMNMEHQQFYKMVQYDASSRVPLVISGAGVTAKGRFVTDPTQAVDMFPTIAELAGVPKADLPTVLDGESLVEYLTPGNRPQHKDFVISQFHGCNIAMSWYLAVNGTYKYVVFGTGNEVPAQLFDLSQDIEEKKNLAAELPDVVAEFDAKLRSEIDYVAVSVDVAVYNQKSFKAWMNRTSDWKTQVATGRWADPFTQDTAASLAAIDAWLHEDPKPKACRSEMVYPPAHAEL